MDASCALLWQTRYARNAPARSSGRPTPLAVTLLMIGWDPSARLKASAVCRSGHGQGKSDRLRCL